MLKTCLKPCFALVARRQVGSRFLISQLQLFCSKLAADLVTDKIDLMKFGLKSAASLVVNSPTDRCKLVAITVQDAIRRHSVLPVSPYLWLPTITHTSRRRVGQRSATVPSQWPLQGPGTVCLRQSGPRRPYRRFVKNWRHSFSALDIIINLFHPCTFLWPSTHILLTM